MLRRSRIAGVGRQMRLRKRERSRNSQPLIATEDVVATSAWYKTVLGLESGHGGSDYEQLMSNGCVVMQLQRWDAHEHRHIGHPTRKPYGNGVVLWFRTEGFDESIKRMKEQ